MSGIYIAAIVTTALAVAVFGSLIHKLRLPANQWLLLGAAVLALPLQPLVFYWLRVPLDHWLVARLGSASTSYQWLISLRRCPECHADYDAPVLALNLGHTRYERCPHCRHWHWTKNRHD